MTYPPHLNLKQRQSLDRGRELVADREADHALEVQRSEEIAMSQRKTKLGDTVNRPPSTKPVRAQITNVRELLVDVFEQAEQAEATQQRMAEVGKNVDRDRFPGAWR